MSKVLTVDDIKDDLKTGDIILFDSRKKFPLSLLDKCIKYFTHSNYNHIAVILRDPTFMDKKNNCGKENLKGLFVWESSFESNPDPQDGKVKLGVELTPFDEVLKNSGGTAFIRKLNCSEEKYKETFTEAKLSEIHNLVYDKPYDVNPIDWIKAIFRINFQPQNTKTYWCSALVGVIYSKLGIIKSNIDWSMMRPSDFSLEDKQKHLVFNEGFTLSDYQIEILCE